MHIFPEGNYSLMAALTTGEILGADLVCTRSQISPYHAQAAVTTRVLYFPAELLTKPGLLRESCRLNALNHLLTLISHENMKKEYRLAILSQKGLRERIAYVFNHAVLPSAEDNLRDLVFQGRACGLPLCQPQRLVS